MKLSDDEVKDMIQKLEDHFQEPVMPVSTYCNALETWADIISTNDKFECYDRRDYIPYLFAIIQDIRKSNLLYRLIYLKEELRTEKCPEHKGMWAGCSPIPCKYGCSSESDITGWLPKNKNGELPESG